MSEASPEAPDIDLEPALEDGQGAVRRGPSLLPVLAGAVVAGALVDWYGAHHHMRGLTLTGIVAAAIVLGASVVFGAARVQARRRGTESFLRRFAGAHGWAYVPRMQLRLDTPLLRAGNTQETGCGFVLTIDDLHVRLYEHRRIDGSGADRVVTPYVVLLAALDVPGVGRLRIHPRDVHPPDPFVSKRVELESPELAERWTIEVDAGTDDLAVRRLLDPQTIAAMTELAAADCYLGDYYEAEGGSLLLASGGTIALEDGDYLERTVRDVAPVLARFRAFAGA